MPLDPEPPRVDPLVGRRTLSQAYARVQRRLWFGVVLSFGLCLLLAKLTHAPLAGFVTIAMGLALIAQAIVDPWWMDWLPRVTMPTARGPRLVVRIAIASLGVVGVFYGVAILRTS